MTYGSNSPEVITDYQKVYDICLVLTSLRIARKYHLSLEDGCDLLNSIVQYESSGKIYVKNPNPDSSAHGMFQIVKGSSYYRQSWLDLPPSRSIVLQFDDMARYCLKPGKYDQIHTDDPWLWLGTRHNTGINASSHNTEYLSHLLRYKGHWAKNRTLSPLVILTMPIWVTSAIAATARIR